MPVEYNFLCSQTEKNPFNELNMLIKLFYKYLI